MDSSEREAQFLDSSFNGLHLDQSSEYDYFRNSAVHRFPVEILVQIFLDVLAEPGLPITSTPFDCSQLWRLGHICARWRSIVCSDIPLVWSNIKVNFRSSIRVAQLAPHSVEILQVCLHRTQDCPLTIAFACATHTGSPHQDDWLRCLELLVGVSDRWKSIDFSIPITVLSRFAPVKGRLPLLETLQLSLDPPNTHSLPHAVGAFEDAPRLTSVATSSHLSMDSFRLPWNQLTSYRTQRTDVGDCVEVLQLSPYLRSLYVRLDAITKVLPSLGPLSTSESDPLPSMPKSHNFLTSLSVNGLMRPGSEHVLLQRLLKLQFNISEAFFPSLTELRLVTSPGSLVNFVTPASPTSCFGSALTKLTIRGVFDAEADYVGAKEFLSSLPSIRELVFGVCFHRDQKVVRILYDILSISKSDQKVVLPQLEVLVLDIDYGGSEVSFIPGWATDPMKRMILSRRRNDGHTGFVLLRKFHLYLASWNTPRKAFAEHLETLEEDAFEVRVLRGL